MPHVLVDAHVKLRRGEFDQQLRDLIFAKREAWRTLDDEHERLKANYVVAEVLDYFGEYALAGECLKKTGPDQLETLKNGNGKESRARRIDVTEIASAATRGPLRTAVGGAAGMASISACALVEEREGHPALGVPVP